MPCQEQYPEAVQKELLKCLAVLVDWAWGALRVPLGSGAMADSDSAEANEDAHLEPIIQDPAIQTVRMGSRGTSWSHERLRGTPGILDEGRL
eukprot:5427141-Pyramimonas_sp.AAC.1